MVRLVRGSSINTEICGIFIDHGTISRWAPGKPPLTWLWGVNYDAPRSPLFTADGAESASPLMSTAATWHAAQAAYNRQGIASRQQVRLLAYRAAMASQAPKSLLARWRWALDIWTPADRSVFDHKMNQVFRARLKQWKGLKAFMQGNNMWQANSGELGHG